jgi:predicted HTH domain antitoxin
MKTLTLQIPDNINEQETKMLIAALLFEKGIYTSGEAAHFANITKRAFIEQVGKYGVSVFGETVSDLKFSDNDAKEL